MDVTVQFLVLVPIVVGLVEAIKQLGLSHRFAPLLSVVLGIVGAMLIGTVDQASVIQGVIAGLTASGLWSGVKKSIEG